MATDIDVFKKARDTVDLFSFVEKMYERGRRAGGSTRWSECPHCGPGGATSSRLCIRSGAAKYKCFTCGESGGVVDFAAALWGISPLDAARDLIDDEFVVAPRDTAREEREKKAETEKALARREMVRRLYAGLPGKVINQEAMDYFCRTRKIAPKVMLKALERKIVAFLPSDTYEANELIREIVGDDILRKAEILKDPRKRMSLAFRPAVFFAHGGNEAEFRLIRAASGNESKAMRYGGGNNPWFWEGAASSGQCVVTEGAVDLLSQASLGFDGDVMGLPSSNNFKLHWFKMLHERGRVKRFVIRLDNDAVKNPQAQEHSGNKWAASIHDKLSEAGIESIIMLPIEGDINDQLIACLERKRERASQ